MSIPANQAAQQLNAAVNQGIQLMKAGQLQHAAQCFQQVLAHAPNHPEALYRLGITLFHLKQTEAAEKALTHLLKVHPNHVTAQISLGNIYTQSQRLDKAIASHKAFLGNNPKNAAVYYYLAVNYVYAGEHEHAIEALRKAIALNPKEEAPHLLLGSQLFKDNEYEDAQAAYEKAYALGFRSFELIENLAKAHTTLGAIDKAKAVYKEGCRLFPDKFVLPYQLSRIDQSIIDANLHSRVQTYLKTHAGEDKNTMYALYLAARYAKVQQDTVQECEYLAAAHKIYREIGEFRNDREFYLQTLPTLARTRQLGSLKPLDEQTILGSMTPVFLVGVPRSGSTLAESILCSGTHTVHKSEESGVMLHSTTPDQFQDSPDFWSEYSKQIERDYDGFDVLEKSGVFTDKSLDNVYVLDVILELFPKAKIVWCKRTPMASLVSIWQNNLFSMPWAHQLSEIVQYFENTNALMKHWCERYPDRIYALQYENLVAQPEEESRALYEFCELPWSPECLEFYKKKGTASRTASNVQVRKAVNKHAAEAFTRYIAPLQHLVDKHPWLVKQ